ncbi:MAG: SDR family oxidoreductase [Candidatus Omnitrophica bacterium]|nr:SDR family oxidoreductase [Candidatus Omnitrophota bacterium]
MSAAKTILITGTSSGFGLSAAVYLTSQGHQVIATMRDLNKQDALFAKLRQHKVSQPLKILPLDVTDHKSIADCQQQLDQAYGGLDVLINNAGFAIAGFFVDLTEKDIRDQMEVNFFGAQNVTRAMLPLLRARRAATIINISSISGLTAYPALGAYNASKWALEGYSESLYYELKPFGIRVALIEPGSYKTKIFYENAHYATHFNNPFSPYYQVSQDLKIFMHKHLKPNHRDPVEIAKLIEKIINHPNSGLRHIPDWQNRTLILLRKILPFSVYSSIVYQISSKGIGAWSQLNKSANSSN